MLCGMEWNGLSDVMCQSREDDGEEEEKNDEMERHLKRHEHDQTKIYVI